MIIEDAKFFNIEATIHEDVTAYGNRFFIQVEDSETEDNKFLRELMRKRFVISCIAIELPDGSPQRTAAKDEK